VASIGALKAGLVQTALETAFPEARLDYLLKHSGATAIVTDSRHAAFAAQLGSVPIINIDELDDVSESDSGFRLRAEDPICIDYTSGSTGQPKGIVWNQRRMLQVIGQHTNVSHVCRHDGWLMLRASLRAYLVPLLNGARFYPVDLALEEPAALAEWMMREDVTIYRTSVSQYRSLTTILAGAERFPRLRLVLLYGEPVFHTDVETYRRGFADDCILGGSLGCNELDDLAYYFVDKDTELPTGVFPCGYPAPNVEVLLLGETGLPVASGEVGELAVRVADETVGYWRAQELTNAAFVRDPMEDRARLYRTGDLCRRDEDGCLFHMGRRDHEVKIRGYRVDVSLVEAALLAISAIRQAVVVGHDTAEHEKQLVAYVVPAGKRVPTVSEMRQILGASLPDYAVPSIYVVLDVIPMTATAKVDRRRLPAPDGTRPALDVPFVEPRTPVEQTLAGIWADVLNVTKVGVLDSFLDLGGNSLIATRVIARVMSTFHVRPPVQSLLSSPTVADMALVILKEQAGSLSAGDIDDVLSRLSDLSDEEARALLEDLERR